MENIRLRFTSLTADLPPVYWFLWAGTVVNRLGGFVIPFLTLYLTTQRGVSVSQAALMASLFGAGSFTSQLAGGELADRLGRRPVMLMSFLITPIFTILLGLANNLHLIAFLTLVMGFFTDLYRPAVSASVADLVPASARTRAFGYIYWAINLGAALAPILAGFMARYNFFLLFLGDALTTLIYGLIVLWRVPETQPAEVVHSARVPIQTRLKQLGQEPILLLFTFLSLLFGMIYMQGNVTLPLDMQAHGLGPADYGLAIAVNGALIVLVTIQLSHFISRWPRFGAMASAAFFLGLGFGITELAHDLPVFAVSVAIWTIGEIIGATVAPVIISDLAPLELRGLYQGIFGSAWGLAFFIGPLLGGWIFENFGPSALWSGCFALGCLVAISYLSMARPAARRLDKGKVQA
jgi:MFS family permease